MFIVKIRGKQGSKRSPWWLSSNWRGGWVAASTLHSPEHCPPPSPSPPPPPPPVPPHLPRLSTGAPLRGRPTHPSRSPPHKIAPLGRLAFPQQLCTLKEIKKDRYLPHNYDVEYCFEGWSVMMRALQGECHACWYRVLAISIPPRLQESYYPSFGFNHRIYHWSSFDLFHTSYCKTAAICPVD